MEGGRSSPDIPPGRVVSADIQRPSDLGVGWGVELPLTASGRKKMRPIRDF